MFDFYKIKKQTKTSINFLSKGNFHFYKSKFPYFKVVILFNLGIFFMFASYNIGWLAWDWCFFLMLYSCCCCSLLLLIFLLLQSHLWNPFDLSSVLICFLDFDSSYIYIEEDLKKKKQQKVTFLYLKNPRSVVVVVVMMGESDRKRMRQMHWKQKQIWI